MKLSASTKLVSCQVTIDTAVDTAVATHTAVGTAVGTAVTTAVPTAVTTALATALAIANFCWSLTVAKLERKTELSARAKLARCQVANCRKVEP